jgi:ADP-ribose pyrophosphatase
MEKNVITDYEVKDKKELYNGFVKLNEVTISDGDSEFTREVIDTTNSIAVVIYDTQKKKYIFVEQYRAGADGLMLEVVAGAIDEGETQEEAAKREIMEETGYKVDIINHIKDFYITPGRANEIVSLFYCEVSERVNDGGGIGDENIGIVEVEKLGLGGRLFFTDPDLSKLSVTEQEITKPPYQLIDAKSLIAVMWLEKNNILKDMAEVITQAKIRSL